jgi:hypothetical protein
LGIADHLRARIHPLIGIASALTVNKHATLCEGLFPVIRQLTEYRCQRNWPTWNYEAPFARGHDYSLRCPIEAVARATMSSNMGSVVSWSRSVARITSICAGGICPTKC